MSGEPSELEVEVTYEEGGQWQELTIASDDLVREMNAGVYVSVKLYDTLIFDHVLLLLGHDTVWRHV